MAVTDHNTMDGAFEMAERLPIPVILGEEIKSTEGDIIGLFLSHEIPRDMSPAETVAAIREQGGLVLLPHPFDGLRRSALGRAAVDSIVDDIDIFEVFNGRTLLRRDNDAADRYADEHSLIKSVGSDSHLAAEIGHCCQSMRPWDDPQDFLASLREAELHASLGSCLGPSRKFTARLPDQVRATLPPSDTRLNRAPASPGAGNAARQTPSFNRRATTLLLPASLNLGITHVLAPALNGLMARSVEPEAAIGGYAIAMGVMGLVALPQMRIQQLTLVFLDDQGSLSRLRRFVAFFALLSGLAAAVVAFTPVLDLLLDGVFATTGVLRAESAAALVALAPFPVLAIVRTHLYGVALRIGRPRLVWVGTGAGAVTVIVVAAVVLWLDPSAGAAIAAIAVTAGAGVESLVLVVGTTGPLRRDLEPSDGSPPTYAALLRFFGPLLVAAFLPSVTQPVINAILTRAPEPEASVAAVSLTFGVNQIFLIALWGVQPTLLALMGRGESPAACSPLRQHRGPDHDRSRRAGRVHPSAHQPRRPRLAGRNRPPAGND